MATTIDERELPQELSIIEAIEAAYPDELTQCAESIGQRLPLLLTCDKEMTQYLFVVLRQRIRDEGLNAVYIDGRVPEEPTRSESGPQSMGMGAMLTGMAAIVQQLRDAVRDNVENVVLVLPHLDLLTTSTGGLTSEAREVIALLYESPNVLVLGFCDPSFPLPKVIEQLFPRQVAFVGLRRDRIRHIVTQAEARKFSSDLTFQAIRLFKYVSGLNAIRLRRVLPTITGEDYPADPQRAFRQLRQKTLSGKMTIPEVDIDKDIGGYKTIKTKLKEEILDLLDKHAESDSEESAKAIEGLIPRGMIFWGPPGSGKTLFAKAMATSLEATVIIVSGPELKSKWVGQGEQNIRDVFRRARQSAPSVIVFDELDSIASQRTAGGDGGSRADASMVNQLLTEMDGFRSDELVFVVGTTNFVEALDGALLRPGRFEFHLEVPYPDEEARQAILQVYNEKMSLQMSADTVLHAARLTDGLTPDTNTPYSGDHLQALCRQIARDRLRDQRGGETTNEDVEDALDKRVERKELTPKEKETIAVHEAGHAIVALFTEGAPPIQRVTLRTRTRGTLGELKFGDMADELVMNEKHLLARLRTLYGGIEAERLFMGAVAGGGIADLNQASQMATVLATQFALGQDGAVPRAYMVQPSSQLEAKRIDKAINTLLGQAQRDALRIIEEHRAELVALRDILIEKGTVDKMTIEKLAKRKEG